MVQKKSKKKFGQFFAENLFLNKIDVGIKSMESIEKHIEVDKEILANPNTSPQQRRHVAEELHDLEEYVEHHKEEIEAGDHHDPSPLELYCCLLYTSDAADE